MKSRPDRTTTAGRAYLELRRLAAARGRATAELLQLYALEGFLARLQVSPHAQRFALKGGLLLAAFEVRRPTKDVDLSTTSLRNDTDTVRCAIREIVTVPVEDGLEFAPAEGAAEIIREKDDYSGVRVTVPCRLSSAAVDFHVDVSVGDPIWPGATDLMIPRLLGGEPLRVRGHPVAMVLAEKIVTTLQRGTANTRWRDFVDILALSRLHPIQSRDLSGAIWAVARHRRATVQPLRLLLNEFPDAAQRSWSTWRRRRRMEAATPTALEDALAEIAAFADPVLLDREFDATWDPAGAAWDVHP